MQIKSCAKLIILVVNKSTTRWFSSPRGDLKTRDNNLSVHQIHVHREHPGLRRTRLRPFFRSHVRFVPPTTSSSSTTSYLSPLYRRRTASDRHRVSICETAITITHHCHIHRTWMPNNYCWSGYARQSLAMVGLLL